MLSRLARTLLTTNQRSKSLLLLIPRELSSQQQLQPDRQPQHISPSLWLSDCKKFVVLDDHQKQLSEFPLLWLRDNCQCSQCCHSEVNRRILDWSTFEQPQELASLKVGCWCWINVVSLISCLIKLTLFLFSMFSSMSLTIRYN